mmetsp:Transcript_2661/g.2976  ORF Transcript_2661/g.2976 Transcript_2661/m.2976 type:complete len:469 (+) Transcript_2661:1-1407(+)
MLLNMTVGETIPVVVYNDLSWVRRDVATLPINSQNIQVSDSAGNAVRSQVNPSRFSNAPGSFNLFFEVNIPAMGFETYFITRATSTNNKPTVETTNEATVLSNSIMTVSIGNSGIIESIGNAKSGIKANCTQQGMAYTSYSGGGQQSGAYIFKPSGPAHTLSSSSVATVSVKGELVQEVFQTFPSASGSSYYSQVLRLYNTSDSTTSGALEILHQVGVLPQSTEMITRFTSDISNGEVVYTDDNGYQTKKRTADKNSAIPINYWPSVYWAYIQDSTRRLTVVHDSSHGASTQASGSMELMVHRRTPYDDGRGLGEALDDTHIVHPTHRVLLDDPQDADLARYHHTYRLNFPLNFYFGKPSSRESWTASYRTTLAPIKAIPDNIHVLSFSLINAETNTFVLRLTHLFGVAESKKYASPVTVDLSDVFSGFYISKIVEMALTGNSVVNASPGFKILLSPKEIRTFYVSLK